MSTFDVYLIIFLVGGFVIGSMVYTGVKGILSVMNRFHPPSYPMYGAPSQVAAPPPTSRQTTNTDNSMVNWLLFITICLAAYSLLSNADIEDIKSQFENSEVVAPAAVHESSKMQISNNYDKTEKVKLVDASIYTKPLASDKFFIQLVASNQLQKIQERGRKYQYLYPTRIGIIMEQYPFKLLIGPFDSEEDIAYFQKKHPKLQNKWIRQSSEFSKVVIIESQ